ncbi:hypothetical protein FRC01_000797 [Tulasnella sp. 417]|nr:hypothetical protein FRC01_000797 [Tulasnella sp. 417]
MFKIVNFIRGRWGDAQIRDESPQDAENELMQILGHGAIDDMTAPGYLAPQYLPASSPHSWDFRGNISAPTRRPSTQNRQDNPAPSLWPFPLHPANSTHMARQWVGVPLPDGLHLAFASNSSERLGATGDSDTPLPDDVVRSLASGFPQQIEGNAPSIPAPDGYHMHGGAPHTTNIELQSLHVVDPSPERGEDEDQDPHSRFQGVLNDQTLGQVAPRHDGRVPTGLHETRTAPIGSQTSAVAENTASTTQDLSREERSTIRRTGAADAFVGVTQRNSGQRLMDDALERGMLFSQLGIESEPPAWLDFNALGSRTKAFITAGVLAIVLLGATLKLYQTIHSSPSTH